MSHDLQFFIDGRWTDPATPRSLDVVDPSTEAVFAQVAMGSEVDVDRAVAAAKAAFPAFARTSPAERRDMLRRILEAYDARSEDLARAISREMGAPLTLARDGQVWVGRAHIEKMIEVMGSFAFETRKGSSVVVKEPIGVVGLITPWNWPLNQITCKVAPALAAGCTMVLKPSEIAPFNAVIFAEILEAAGVPPGVFNLVNGDGPTVGHALSSHPDVDMMSFTGSTRAGVLVAKAAAETVKRVSQELGGKSANILLPDVDLRDAVTRGIDGCFGNSGQSCNAPTRMFVPRALHAEAIAVAGEVAAHYRVGPADAAETIMGPVVSQMQFDKIQGLIQSGIDEGATLVAGGPGRPADLEHGYYVRPTIFADVTPDMRISREEIFGPVLSILPYDDVDAAVDEANNTVYGLAAYVQGRDLAQARDVARRMRAGNVRINAPAWDAGMPFGGYKQSGNGREYAEYGLEDFLEIKGILGFEAP